MYIVTLLYPSKNSRTRNLQVLEVFINQMCTGNRPACAWFLKIDTVWIVGMCVCVCVGMLYMASTVPTWSFLDCIKKRLRLVTASKGYGLY